MVSEFKALVVREESKGQMTKQVETRCVDDLPAGELLIRVHYSALNYKDALSASGNRGVTKEYPHTPGIDSAGVVEVSDHPDFRPGQEVIVTSYDLGTDTPGGLGQYIRVPAAWAVSLPDGLTLKESMAYGTAGFTAALAVLTLEENGVAPGDGPVLVTGATGGVGSLAVAILAKAGYSVTAATGKAEEAEFLKSIGASEVIGREDVLQPENRPMCKGRWAGVVDSIGGVYLDSAIRSTVQHGVVTCIGMLDSHVVKTSIFPFIIRGVSLHGIDSAFCEMKRRKEVWSRLASSWKVSDIDRITVECGLGDVVGRFDAMLAGESRGHVRVNMLDA